MEGNHIIVRISPAEGDFPEQVEERRINVVLHHSAFPRAVLINGSEIDDWSYDASLQHLDIPLYCPVKDGVEVEISLVR
jgi:hypothetical protein